MYQCKDGVTSATKQIKVIWTNMTMLCSYKTNRLGNSNDTQPRLYARHNEQKETNYRL